MGELKKVKVRKEKKFPIPQIRWTTIDSMVIASFFFIANRFYVIILLVWKIILLTVLVYFVCIKRTENFALCEIIFNHKSRWLINLWRAIPLVLRLASIYLIKEKLKVFSSFPGGGLVGCSKDNKKCSIKNYFPFSSQFLFFFVFATVTLKKKIFLIVVEVKK